MPASAMEQYLGRVHRDLADLTDGAVASYIPELSKVEPDQFGLALATLDGHVDGTGDDDALFTIQSISKPFVYGLALDDHGVDHVIQRVGVEPSGDAFNSIVMDERNNRPLNPMVNAGAIACAAMVKGTGLEERRQRVLDTFSRYAGRPLTIDWKVAESERRTGHRNRAIAYLELSSGMIEEPVDEHLDLYFEQCSILVTARDLALMAATLANGGVNPVTGERALAGRERLEGPRGDGHLRDVRLVRGVDVPGRTAGQVGCRRRDHRRVARPDGLRHVLPPPRRVREQLPRRAGVRGGGGHAQPPSAGCHGHRVAGGHPHLHRGRGVLPAGEAAGRDRVAEGVRTGRDRAATAGRSLLRHRRAARAHGRAGRAGHPGRDPGRPADRAGDGRGGVAAGHAPG